MLTSLTTFAGLVPMMADRSMQAAFFIPMAVSLAFGVLFATFITLLLVPIAYAILVDLQGLPRRLLASVASAPDAGRAGAAPRVSHPAPRMRVRDTVY